MEPIEVLKRTTSKGEVTLTIEVRDNPCGGGCPYPYLVARLDGQEKNVGDLWTLHPSRRPKGYEDCTHVAADVVALLPDEHERIKAALGDARDAFSRDKAAKLNEAIPGLDLLRAACEREEEYRDDFAAMMEDERNDGARPPKAPEGQSVAELARQYPRAALYLRAESYSEAHNDNKVGAGEKALRMLLDGETIEAVTKVLDNWVPASAMWD